MRDSVAAGRGVAPARECSARIRALLNGGSAPAPTPASERGRGSGAAACSGGARFPAGAGGARCPHTPEVPDTPHQLEIPQAEPPPPAPVEFPTRSFERLTESAFEVPLRHSWCTGAASPWLPAIGRKWRVSMPSCSISC